MTQYTLHPDQISELHWRSNVPTGRIGARLEIVKCLSKILSGQTKKTKQISKLLQSNLNELINLLETVMPEL